MKRSHPPFVLSLSKDASDRLAALALGLAAGFVLSILPQLLTGAPA